MDSKPRRRRRLSREEPPDLSELKNKCMAYTNSFIETFDNREEKMRETVGEFQMIAEDEVTGVEEEADTVRTTGVVTRRVGKGLIGLGIIAAPITGGASLAIAGAGIVLEGAAAAAAAEKAGVVMAAVAAAVTAAAAAKAGVAVAAGVAAAVAALVAAAALGGAGFVGARRKKMKKDRSAEKVEKLGKEFMEIIEPLTNDLEEIKTMCEKLEEKSVEVQAENTLRDVEELQRILGRVSTVGRRASIIHPGDQCQKVVDQFDQMKKKLKDFKDTEEEKHKQQREEETSFTLKHGD